MNKEPAEQILTSVSYTHLMPVIPLWKSNLILLAKDLKPCTSILFKYIFRSSFSACPQMQDRLISRHLLRRFFGPAFPPAQFSSFYRDTGQKLFVMIRAHFIQDSIDQALLAVFLLYLSLIHI